MKMEWNKNPSVDYFLKVGVGIVVMFSLIGLIQFIEGLFNG